MSALCLVSKLCRSVPAVRCIKVSVVVIYCILRVSTGEDSGIKPGSSSVKVKKSNATLS